MSWYSIGRRSPAWRAAVNAAVQATLPSQARQGRAVTNQAIVDTMVERIVARFQPARILLFGSRARGTDNRWSDVDLLVVMDEVEDKRRAAVEMSRSLGDLTVSKDIVVTTPDEIARRGNVVGSVLRAALREGKVVYDSACRRPGAGCASHPRTSMQPDSCWRNARLPRATSAGIRSRPRKGR